MSDEFCHLILYPIFVLPCTSQIGQIQCVKLSDSIPHLRAKTAVGPTYLKLSILAYCLILYPLICIQRHSFFTLYHADAGLIIKYSFIKSDTGPITVTNIIICHRKNTYEYIDISFAVPNYTSQEGSSG